MLEGQLKLWPAECGRFCASIVGQNYKQGEADAFLMSPMYAVALNFCVDFRLNYVHN